MIFADLARRAHTARRSSGTATRPTFGSRVENAYFVVSAACVAVNALNNADFPTLGRPTIPQLKPISFPHQTIMTGHGPVIPRAQLFAPLRYLTQSAELWTYPVSAGLVIGAPILCHRGLESDSVVTAEAR